MNHRSIRFWHKRYIQQASWTGRLRQYFFQQIVLNNHLPILEVGCGTGALLREYSGHYDCIGVDVNFPNLQKSKRINPKSVPVCGNGLSLPLKSKSFSVSYCHFLLLWIKNPADLIAEMIRVTAPGGYIAVFAEPDYSPAKHTPPEIMHLQEIQSKALMKEGADPFIGSKIGSLLELECLKNIQSGKYGNFFNYLKRSEINLEISVFAQDHLLINNDDDSIIAKYRRFSEGRRLPYLTDTYYAFGQVCSE